MTPSEKISTLQEIGPICSFYNVEPLPYSEDVRNIAGLIKITNVTEFSENVASVEGCFSLYQFKDKTITSPKEYRERMTDATNKLKCLN